MKSDDRFHEDNLRNLNKIKEKEKEEMKKKY